MRMFFIMVISLYTSRVVLSTLGVIDFGIYNAVGGVVTMMGVLSGAMSVATQRYLTFELGRGDRVRLKQVFSMCLSIFILLSFILILLSESVGLWLVNYKMVIPVERIEAANWILQYSILSSVATVLMIPYNAAIIAHERMNIYAYVGILDAVLKLIIVYLLLWLPSDKLSAYGFLMFFIHAVVACSYIIYGLSHFPETRYKFYWEKSLFWSLITYSGWNLFGSLSGVAKGQGLNILLNLFFNPSVNAARGIAYQINSAVTQFFTNFYTAVRPQITKYYAQKNLDEMYKLIFRSSKLSFYLIMLVSVPLIIETPYIVNLWLGQLPEYVVPFTRIIIAISAIDAMSTPLMTAAHATGRIALYQFTVGMLNILILPISYLFLTKGCSPVSVFYVSLTISFISLFIRIWIVRRLMEFPVYDYILKVVINSLFVSLISFVLPLIVYMRVDETFFSVCCVSALSVFSCITSIYFLGVSADERNFIMRLVKTKILNRV